LSGNAIAGSRNAAPSVDIEDPAALLPYLRGHGLIGPADTPRMTRLGGGVSNRIVLVEPPDSAAFVLKQALEKLRVASDWFGSLSRIHCEAQGARALRELAPEGTITALLFEDFEEHVIALSAVPTPHCSWKEILLFESPRLHQFTRFGHTLGQIHARSCNNAVLAEAFDDRSNFESLRLEPYYRFTAARLPAAAGFLNELIEATLSCRICLVHGDYSPKNILVHAGKFVLVDHEVIHYGDPAFDVGFALTHLLAKALHRERVRRRLLEGARLYAKAYLRCVRKAGFDRHFEVRACRHTIGCLLARVLGRSPLEYLSEAERERQSGIAVNLMNQKPLSLPEIILQFEEALD
jgi:5-methylthioribose kinase